MGVIEAGNMTRAAYQLRMAQTAPDMQIRQLEEDLGVALLVRHSRGVEPTTAGSLLHDRAGLKARWSPGGLLHSTRVYPHLI